MPATGSAVLDIKALTMINQMQSWRSAARMFDLELTWPELICWGIAAAMAVAFLVTGFVLTMDARTLDGHESVWLKPLKFELSLAIHAASLALVLGMLSPPLRQHTALLVVTLAFLVACTVEMGWIVLQGARAQQSHFNLATPFTRFMYAVMAFMAVIIIGAAGAIGLAMLGDGAASVAPPLRAAVVAGFIGGMVLTLAVGFTIGGRLGPYVGGVPDASARMALMGWSKSAGDLRVSHFLATHMIQAVPLFALVLGRFATGRAALAFVVIFATGWTVLTMLEFRTALDGKPSLFSRALG